MHGYDTFCVFHNHHCQVPIERKIMVQHQYHSGQYIAAASPKYQRTSREATPTNRYVEGREDVESRDGTTTLMEGDHSTIRTRDDMSLPYRHTPGNLPGWSPALAAQKPPVVIEAAASPQKTTQHKVGEPMDFMQSDNSFQVVASLLVDQFEEALKNRADHIIVTQSMKDQIERVVPEDARENFVAALRFRLAEAPEFSRLPMHTVTRNCHKLGMTRLDEQNILFAPVGTNIKLDVSFLRILFVIMTRTNAMLNILSFTTLTHRFLQRQHVVLPLSAAVAHLAALTTATTRAWLLVPPLPWKKTIQKVWPDSSSWPNFKKHLP